VWRCENSLHAGHMYLTSQQDVHETILSFIHISDLLFTYFGWKMTESYVEITTRFSCSTCNMVYNIYKYILHLIDNFINSLEFPAL
jgi:hypothetical protein